jgi:hypothetical protein
MTRWIFYTNLQRTGKKANLWSRTITDIIIDGEIFRNIFVNAKQQRLSTPSTSCTSTIACCSVLIFNKKLLSYCLPNRQVLSGGRKEVTTILPPTTR